MFNLKLHTNGMRIDRIVNVNERVCDILDREDVSTQGATVSVNGAPVRDLSATFAELGITEGTSAILAVVVKTESAQ